MGPIIHYLERSEVWGQIRLTDLLKNFFLAFMQLVMLIAGWFIVPIGLLFCNKDSEHMPKLFWLWDNAVDTINGDEGKWKEVCEKAWFLKDPTSYWTRWKWLAIRNAARNYSMFVGVRPCDVEEIWINKQYDENPHRRQCNSLIVKARTWDDKYYTMWMPSWRVKFWKWDRFLGKFGFKLWDLIPLARMGDKEKRQFTFYGWFQKGMKCEE